MPSRHWRFHMSMPTLVRSFNRRDRRVAAVTPRQTDRQRARGGVSSAPRHVPAVCGPIVLSAARSGASRHLVVGVDVRSTTTTPCDGSRRRRVPPESRGQKPQSGQERPPRQRRFAAPALTPEGVAPARPARPPAADEMTRGLRFLFLFRRAFARRNRTRIRLTRRRRCQPSNRARLRSTSLATTACMGRTTRRCACTPRLAGY